MTTSVLITNAASGFAVGSNQVVSDATALSLIAANYAKASDLVIVPPALPVDIAKSPAGSLTAQQVAGISQNIIDPAGVVKVGGGIPYSTRPTVGFAGDSIALALSGQSMDSALWWVTNQLYPCEYIQSMVVAVGGKTSAQIVAEQIAGIQAAPPQILFLNGGTNDSSGLVTAATVFTNFVTVTAAAIAAGVKMVILMPISPKSNVAQDAVSSQRLIKINRSLQAYAHATDKVYYWDYSGALSTPNGAVFSPIGDAVGGSGSVMIDGLHWSAAGARAAAVSLKPILQPIFRPRLPRAIHLSDIWDATLNNGGNYLGTAGLFAGTNGTLNAVGNAGVAANWVVASSNGITVTPSLVSAAYVNSGYTAQRLAFSGTVTGSGNVAFCTMSRVIFNAAYFTDVPKIDFEGVIRNQCPGLVGLSINIGLSGGTSVNKAIGGSNATAVAANTMADTDTTWFMFPEKPVQSVSGNNQVTVTLSIFALVGTVLSGSIDCSHFGVFKEVQ